MKLSTQTYYLFTVLIVLCLNAGSAFNPSSLFSGKFYIDTIKVTKLSELKDKIKLEHKHSDNQVRIETEFQAADQLSAEIINMIGVSCQKTNFRVNTTIDYTLKPGMYFVVVYFKQQRIFSSKILVSQ